MYRLLFLFLFFAPVSYSQKIVYESLRAPEDQLVRACTPFLSLSERELTGLVPVQGGFRFCGSPESLEGAQENNMIWKLSYGDKVQCQFTKTFFPSRDYPENGFIDVKTPTGKIQRFKFHQAENGKKYWFEGRKWYEQRVLLERAAYQLAQLYSLDPVRYAKAGGYAALILKRFAALYPDYIVSFDYPGKDKEFYTAETYPAEVARRKQDAWRLAKWSWWAYMDVSENLLLAYDLLRDPAILPEKDRKMIEKKLFLPMLDFVAAYGRLSTTNMHPTLWRAQSVAANVLGIPQLTDTVNNGISRMLKEQFTHDGFWKETSVSYHRQTAFGLFGVFEKLYPGLTEAERTVKMEEMHPSLALASKADEAFRLPNGHYASINDTWSYDRYEPVIEESIAHLKTGIGYGVLGMGRGPHQLQAHLSFNGQFGHDHFASLNLTLFGKGKELVSDLGYTHTKARTWATSTTAHNLVVINGKSQAARPAPYSGTGSLLLFSAADAGFQAIEAGAPNSYRQENISVYRRALIAVAGSDQDHYVLDIFNVRGPGQKDWILHGDAGEAQRVTTVPADGSALSWEKRTSLLPVGRAFKEIDDLFDFKLLWEPFWAHGNFRNVRQARASGPLRSTFTYAGTPGKGLQTWLLSNTGSTVSEAESWSIRNAKENQGRLDEFLRSSVIISRHDTAARFTAVHVPFDGKPFVENVTMVWEDENSAIVKVAQAGGTTDYLIYQSDHRRLSVRLEGQELDFDGRIGFIRIRDQETILKMIDGNRLSFGPHSLEGASFSSPLLSVTGNRLLAEGRIGVEPGEIIILQHGDGKTSSFHVESVVHDHNRTTILTREPPVYETGTDRALILKVFPFFSYPGPHVIRTSILSKDSFSK